jgi:hypothetical protein
METGTEKSLQEAELQLRDRGRGYRDFFKNRDRESPVGVSTVMNNLLWQEDATTFIDTEN